MPQSATDVSYEELETDLAYVFHSHVSPHPGPRKAAEVAAEAEMVAVMAHPDGSLLLMDPYSATHYLFEPTGPFGEYEDREHVDDIVVGEPIPDRFVAAWSDWEPLDRDWRRRVTNGSLEADA